MGRPVAEVAVALVLCVGGEVVVFVLQQAAVGDDGVDEGGDGRGEEAAVEGQADGRVVTVNVVEVGDDVEGEHGKGEGQFDDVRADHDERGQTLRGHAGNFDDVEDERREVEAHVGGFPAERGQ